MDGTNRDGVVGFNESNTFKKITIGTDTGNLPASDVRAFSQIIETNYG
jgi:hypothetical protein